MGFRENLKAELAYKDMLVKELADRAGLSKRTIDNYLREKGSMPPADAAVRIALALGVSVEYLVTGEDRRGGEFSGLALDIRGILDALKELDGRDRGAVASLTRYLREQRLSR